MVLLKVIGIGSPFGTDQAGWICLEQIKEQLQSHHFAELTIEFTRLDRPGPELLSVITGAHYAILIDALVDNTANHRVVRLDRTQLLEDHKAVSSHAIGVGETLSLGAALNCLPDHLVLYGLAVRADDGIDSLENEINSLTGMVVSDILNLELQFSRQDAHV